MDTTTPKYERSSETGTYRTPRNVNMAIAALNGAKVDAIAAQNGIHPTYAGKVILGLIRDFGKCANLSEDQTQSIRYVRNFHKQDLLTALSGWENGKETNIVHDNVSVNVDDEFADFGEPVVHTSTRTFTPPKEVRQLTESEIAETTQIIAEFLGPDDLNVLRSIQLRGYNGSTVDPVYVSTKGNRVNAITRGQPGFLTPLIVKNCLDYFVNEGLGQRGRGEKEGQFLFKGGIHSLVEQVLAWHKEKESRVESKPETPVVATTNLVEPSDEMSVLTSTEFETPTTQLVRVEKPVVLQEIKESTAIDYHTCKSLFTAASSDNSMVDEIQQIVLKRAYGLEPLLLDFLLMLSTFDLCSSFNIEDLECCARDYAKAHSKPNAMDLPFLLWATQSLSGFGFGTIARREEYNFTFIWFDNKGKPYTADALIKTILS